MSSAYAVIPYRLLTINWKLSSTKLSNFSDARHAFDAIMCLLEPKGVGVEQSVLNDLWRTRLYNFSDSLLVQNVSLEAEGSSGWNRVYSMIYGGPDFLAVA
jgi:hypothetical protein